MRHGSGLPRVRGRRCDASGRIQGHRRKVSGCHAGVLGQHPAGRGAMPQYGSARVGHLCRSPLQADAPPVRNGLLGAVDVGHSLCGPHRHPHNREVSGRHRRRGARAAFPGPHRRRLPTEGTRTCVRLPHRLRCGRAHLWPHARWHDVAQHGNWWVAWLLRHLRARHAPRRVHACPRPGGSGQRLLRAVADVGEAGVASVCN
mmetsp:Transcript_97101/g.274480  ORF Transcript_97101/g.274480 Transcript_97101/m.274480 type:complete len:202 (+) Transcript_97101:257-862(+)